MLATELLPISESIQPTSEEELAAAVRSCHGDDVAVYPVGGATSLDFGLPPRKPGIALSLQGMQRVVDYPARDMTVTIESGVTLRALADLLGTQRQRLPVDVPSAERATMGGVIATNFNGPRRYGQGTIRDYVIGIRAVDGRGVAFKGGGRVVKNVAGYDFCKLLTGSLGTIGVITQVTLKLKPQPERLAVAACAPASWQDTESLLAALVQSRTNPVAIEVLAGPAWHSGTPTAGLMSSGKEGLLVAVALEGTDVEVRWMVDQLGREWWSQGVTSHQVLLDTDASHWIARLVEFPAASTAAWVLKASVRPSAVTSFMATAREVDPHCSLQAHAGSGIVIVRLDQPPAAGIAKGLIGQLQAAAIAGQGTLMALSASGSELTRQSLWGTLSGPRWLMNSVKREFDPRNILNPDRFVYG